VKYEDFLTHVVPYVEGCPDLVALDHIEKAAREFCGRTLCWNPEPRWFAADATLDQYPLDLTDDIELVKVLGVSVDGTEIKVETTVRGRSRRRNGDSGPFAYVEDRADIVLVPVPSGSTTEFIVDMAIKPALGTTEFPDELVEYVPDIAHGAIASLCRLPRKAWTDMALAGVEQGLFNNRILSVGLLVGNGSSNSSRRRAPQFI
jgi:hypothetical protein